MNLHELILAFVRALKYWNGWRPGESPDQAPQAIRRIENHRINTGVMRQIKQIAGRGAYPGAMVYIGPLMPESEELQWAFWDTAAAFGQFPDNHGEMSFPRACALFDLRVYRNGRPRSSVEPDDITPVDRRMVRLLRCNRFDLQHNLIPIVRRLAKEDIPFRYDWLLSDLCRWEDGTQDVQRRWGQQFWRAHSADPDSLEAVGHTTAATDAASD